MGTTDSEEQILVPGAAILSLFSLTKVFRCVLARQSFADACLVCNFCDEAATMGISQEDEFVACCGKLAAINRQFCISP